MFFLPDINNDNSVNIVYRKNIMALNNFVLVMFQYDSIVVPRESEWFGFYRDGDLNTILPYNLTLLYLEDRIGIRTLDKLGKLKFLSCPGDHMQFTMTWFTKNIILPFLRQVVPSIT